LRTAVASIIPTLGIIVDVVAVAVAHPIWVISVGYSAVRIDIIIKIGVSIILNDGGIVFRVQAVISCNATGIGGRNTGFFAAISTVVTTRDDIIHTITISITYPIRDIAVS
jgi:hypothetical protein